MAIQSSYDAFNPNVAEVKPGTYIGLSEATKAPHLVSSKGIALGEAGDIIKGAAKATDDIIRTMAINETTNTMYPGREEYINQLEAARDGITGQPVATPADPEKIAYVPIGSSEPVNDSLAPPQNILPPEIKAFQARAEGLGAARANGTISPTEYLGKMATEARGLRSRYGSAYWPAIDATTSNILGVDPANAYIRSVLADINSYATNSQDRRKNVLSMVEEAAKNGVPGADKVWAAVNNGGALEPAVKWVQQANEVSWKAKRIKEQYDIKKNTVGLTEDEITDRFTVATTMNVNAFFNVPDVIMDINGVSQEQRDAPAGAQGAEMRVQAITRQRALAENYLRKTAQEDGTLAALGPDKTDALIQKQLKFFDTALKYATDDKFGDVGRINRLNTAIGQDAKYALLTRFGKFSSFLPLVEQLDKMAPNFLQNWTKGLIEAGIVDEATQAFVVGLKGMMATQTDPTGKPIPPNESFTVKQAFKTAREDGADKPKNLTQLLTLLDNKTEGSLSFLDPATRAEDKIRIAKSFFSPGNLGFIKELSSGQQLEVFKRLTKPDVAQQAYALGPEVFTMYRGWVEQTFAKDLFSKQIRDLNEIQDNKQLAITWDEKHNLFGLVVKGVNGKAHDSAALDTDRIYTDGGGGFLVAPRTLSRVRATLRDLNLGLSSVSNISSFVPGFDTSTYLINILREAWDISPDNIPEGLPAGMQRAILKSREEVKRQRGTIGE